MAMAIKLNHRRQSFSAIFRERLWKRREKHAINITSDLI